MRPRRSRSGTAGYACSSRRCASPTTSRTSRSAISDPGLRWRPEGFEAYRERWPATPALALPDGATSARFAEVWHALEPDPVARARAMLGTMAPRLTVVLVRGYLGNFMRGNLVAACRALCAAGVDAFIARNDAGATVADNARRLAPAVRRHLARDRHGATRELVFGGHSKGGLECLTALATAPDLGARTRAVLLSQTPRGPSHVLESLLLGLHQDSLPSARRRLAERVQRLGLGLLGARPGGLELTRGHLPMLVERLTPAASPYPVVQTASWSSRPTVWLDSFHERLGEIRPGVAHDGQFYLDDLLWPGLEHVLLPHLDHAQPVMSGFGFDSARYWLALVVLVTTTRSGSSAGT